MEALQAWLRLVHARGLGPVHAQRLLAYFEQAPAICAADPATLRGFGLPNAALAALHDTQPPEGVTADAEWARQSDHHILTLADPRYPARLAAIPDPPPVLYVQGDPEVLAYPALALVGTRHPTPAGQDTAHAFAHHLAASGLIVVSGLALGIDAAAHR
ncbi:MAG: DNA-protecting protein DprA, partial [Proteobacteria bacterium SW_6_67_9]